MKQPVRNWARKHERGQVPYGYWQRPSVDVATTYVNIGLVYEKTGRKSEAKTLFTEAAKIRRNKLGPDHPLTRKSERLAAQ